SRWPIVGGGYKQLLLDDYPEIESTMRLWRREFSIRDDQGIIHQQSMFATDNSIFDIFDYRLEEGDPQTALKNPRSVVLTREKAVKYLGSDDVIGETLTMEISGSKFPFNITGIIEEVPENSHVHFDMLVSISTYPEGRFANLRSNYLYTYILTGENTSKTVLEDKLKMFVENRLEPVYGDLLSQGLGIHEVLKMHLFPVTDIHLDPSPTWEVEPQGNKSAVYIFTSIAVLILVIACMNFINLSTARAGKRAKEVGLRKTLGAYKSQLRKQFVHESIVLAAFSIPITVLILSLFIPVYNIILSEDISFASFISLENLLIFAAIIIVVGLVSGLYPAFYLTRFDPANVLKGGVQTGSGRSAFRRNLVVIQFVISIALIIGTFTVYLQMSFIQNRDIGFDKDNVIVIHAGSANVDQNYSAFKDELIRDPKISSVAVSSDVPGVIHYSNTNFIDIHRPNEPVMLSWFVTDFDFVNTYGMNITAGRTFSEDYGTDTTATLILNETAAKRFGWTAEEAVGKELLFSREQAGTIVGVVKDFNYRSVHLEIEPLAIALNPNVITYVSIKILPGEIGRTLENIRQKWENTFPGEQFEYNFLDSRINQLYDNEIKMKNIFIVFSCFSILVACLGLFGLATFIAEERTKEIGIRKVLGAEFSNLYLMLSRDFIIWILIANIIAWPAAWYYMNKWLQNFVYRADIGIAIFLVSAFITVIIAFITISTQIIRSALKNPVDSLRYE
ncbi:MAG: FtsX-like permease family protein, partial [bacterium]|nr:FtsX-like permease family protein [bacterium]